MVSASNRCYCPVPLLTSIEATKANVNQKESQSEDDVDDMETSQHLGRELALSEYDQRQRSYGTDEPTNETNILHQKISQELSKQVGIGGLSPFYRHLIVYSSLRYTLEKQRELRHPTKLHRIRQVLSKLPTWFIFTSDLLVETFAAIAINMDGFLNLFGNSLLIISAGFKILQSLDDLLIRCNIMKFQSDFLKLNKDWLEEHHSHLMEDDDPVLFLINEQPGKETATSDGLDEIDAEPPRRQDTEGDIGIVGHNSTDRTE